MKVHDFAYRVAMRTIELLEEKQHYKVSEENRKDVGQAIIKEIDALIKQSS
ncbi:MAG: hypothetical protein HYV27_17470 [Candidatus Hydrogenedentes bacterium]|nr:hypothetical protein [Candidatus Hydrogenedentota bacterium]